MVDMNVVRQLENDGMEYKNAFRIANLMETEGLTMEEARDKVLDDTVKAEFKIAGDTSSKAETVTLDPNKTSGSTTLKKKEKK